MSDEKPLHVRVAEALGETVRHRTELCHQGQSVCAHHIDEFSFPRPGGPSPIMLHIWERFRRDEDCSHADCTEHGEWLPATRYDTDWSATGPLIEKYTVNVFPQSKHGDEPWTWGADALGFDNEEHGTGPTPLIAVCNLILALAAAGKTVSMRWECNSGDANCTEAKPCAECIEDAEFVEGLRL